MVFGFIPEWRSDSVRNVRSALATLDSAQQKKRNLIDENDATFGNPG
jgi:hypothetical protein